MTPRQTRLCLLALLGAASTSAFGQTPLDLAPPPPEAGAVPAPAVTSEPMFDSLPLKLRDAPLELLLETLEIWTGRVILRPQALPTPLFTITLPKMPRSEAILALETLLNLNQIGLAPMGDRFLKVVALTGVRSETPELLEGSTLNLLPSGHVATKLFQLEFLRLAEVMPQINPLLNPNLGGPVMFEKTNAALITDTISTLQRVEMLLKRLDQPLTAGLTPKFYPVHFATASDLVNKIRTVLQSQPLQSQIGAATSYSADDRTNQIVLIADARQHAFFDDLIAKLDIKADPNTRNEVIHLKNANSKEVATLLGNIVTGQNKTSKGTGSGSVRPGQLVGPNQGQPQPPGAPNMPPGAPPPAEAFNNAGNDYAPSNEFSSLITIQSDDRSNSIVVSGIVDDIRLVRDLIEKIDVPLAQVRIEVVIAEVTLTDSDLSGLSALNLTFGQNGGVTRILNFDATVAGAVISSGVVNPLSFVAGLQKTAGRKSNVRVLQAPTIVTSHNKDAEIVVGTQVPIITGSQATPLAGTATTTPGTSNFSTVSQVTFKDITMDLKVTPLIGDDGNIQLKIDQKIDSKGETVRIDGNEQPSINHNQATSFVNVHDGNLVVLGGFQSTTRTDDRSKIGFLREIPIISQIFGDRTKSIDRKELLLFIRPVIIRAENSVSDTRESIEKLSNKDEVKDYLNPKPPEEKKGTSKGPAKNYKK